MRCIFLEALGATFLFILVFYQLTFGFLWFHVGTIVFCFYLAHMIYFFTKRVMKYRETYRLAVEEGRNVRETDWTLFVIICSAIGLSPWHFFLMFVYTVADIWNWLFGWVGASDGNIAAGDTKTVENPYERKAKMKPPVVTVPTYHGDHNTNTYRKRY